MADQDLVRPAGKGLAGQRDAVLGERRPMHAGGDIQFAAIVGSRAHRVFRREFHEQVAEVPVAAEPVVARFVVAVPVVVAGPEGTLVELDPLDRHAAEEHRAQAAVADGQGLARPGVGRGGIPQHPVLRRRSGLGRRRSRRLITRGSYPVWDKGGSDDNQQEAEVRGVSHPRDP